ncbi:hypothetical protein [Metallosphaera tengchongensis]|nr:hypothetical protein [Metallosphaera tengchongensis]
MDVGRVTVKKSGKPMKLIIHGEMDKIQVALPKGNKVGFTDLV